MVQIGIKSTDLVLEVGSGDFPNYRSDVLVDKNYSDNFQRNKNIWVDDRLFIIADAQRLPFKDKAFGYVIAANILPYIDKPELFFTELMRVAPKGTIQAISELFERLRDIPYHKWYVNLVKNKLVLKKKDNATREFGKLFHMLCERDDIFLRFLNKHWFIFNLTYNWQGKIEYEFAPPGAKVIDLEDSQFVMDLISDKRTKLIKIMNSFMPYRFKSFLTSSLAKAKRRKGRKVDLRTILVCPNCKKEVEIGDDNIVCHFCGKTYPVRNGIPYMIVEN